MIELVFSALDLLRPILFFALLAYLPMRFGISFDVAGKPCDATEVRNAREEQLRKVREPGARSILLAPFRLLFAAYFTVWLMVDRSPITVFVLFVATLIPVYVR